MNEVFQKYKDKIEYLESMGRAYQDLLAMLLSQDQSCVKGNRELEDAVRSLTTRVRGIKNNFQFKQIRKDYSALAKRMDAHMKEQGVKKGGGLLSGLGSLFGGAGSSENEEKLAKLLKEAKKRGQPIELVDSSKDFLIPYVDLLEGFAKGTMLLSDEDDPFYAPLRTQRAKKFDQLAKKTVSSLNASLYNFFINKSNEAYTIETEREELKKIIGSLTGCIKSLSVSSKNFGGKLDEYSRKISAATEISEIKKIKRAIVSETLEIQKMNGVVVNRLSESEQELNKANDKIVRLEKDLEMARQEKSIDALTMVYNRGYFDEFMSKTVANFGRGVGPCCLIMLDIDHFKSFNDTYGHQAGDQVLRIVADDTRESVRASDILARYGGEEFAVILLKTNLKNAAKVAENIRDNIRNHEFGVRGKTIHVTASLGVTEFVRGDNPKTIIARADKGLYAAKEKGRNCVVTVGNVK